MNRKLVAAVALFCAMILVAATYNNTSDNHIITGNGAVTNDIALPMWGVNQNATVQISRNNTGDGGGQGSALDVYSAGNDGIQGFSQRWFIDCAVDGGKCAGMTYDYGSNLLLNGLFTISGVVLDHNGSGFQNQPLSPYRTGDGFMMSIWVDETNGVGIAAAANPVATEGTTASQVFLALDGKTADAGIGTFKPNVRFAIDGNSGALRWSNSIANAFELATWDAKFARVAAHILGDSTTSLQPLHLDQPSGIKDIAGTIALVAQNQKTAAFGTAYASAPVCIISPIAAPGVTYWVTSTAANVTVNLSAASTITFNYVCVGNPN